MRFINKYRTFMIVSDIILTAILILYLVYEVQIPNLILTIAGLTIAGLSIFLVVLNQIESKYKNKPLIGIDISEGVKTCCYAHLKNGVIVVDKITQEEDLK